jgi:putative ABC transport system permease protein
MGASRGRLVSQLLTESVLIGAVAGLAGLALAFIATHALVSMVAGSIPRSGSMGIDARAIGFAAGVSLATGLLFGLVPALGISRARLQDTLKDISSRGSGTSLNLSRKTLVASEAMLAFALVVGAGLLIRSYMRLENVDPGFDPNRVVTASLSLPPTRYPQPVQQGAFTRKLLERMRDVSGIESVAVVNYLPLGGGYSCDAFAVDGEPPPVPGAEPCAEYRRVSSEYFRAMGIPLLQGRTFEESDHEKATPVAIIDETMARRFWGESNPIGERVTVKGISREIIGIVAGVKHFGLDREAPSGLYAPHLQDPIGDYSLVARTHLQLSTFSDFIRKEVSALDADLPVYNVRTMEELLSRSLSQPRFRTSLLGLFAVAALVLASIGVYGVVYQSTSTRRREMAVRMALGAGRAEVQRIVLREGLQLGAIGLVLGALLALGLTRFLSGFLFEIRSYDPVTFAGVGAVLLSSILLASYLPARRASRIEPNIALRYE